MSEATLTGTSVPVAMQRRDVTTISIGRLPDLSIMVTLARKEIRDSLRNRWFILYTMAFTILALALSFLALGGTGVEGMAGFGRTAASMINLVILIIPLMALTAGATSLAAERERGTLSYLLAQPISRFELLLGKYIGLAVALLAALCLGFGLSAGVMAWRGGTADIASYGWLVGLSLVLALGMLSVGFLISVLSRKASVGNGAAIFLWLTFVFIGDLGLMGSTLIMHLRIEDLFHLSLINPMQVFKIASLNSIHASLDVLGPAGIYAMQEYGRWLNLIFAGMLSAWIVLPMVIAQLLFNRRGVS